jgi:hypothetical protein
VEAISAPFLVYLGRSLVIWCFFCGLGFSRFCWQRLDAFGLQERLGASCSQLKIVGFAHGVGEIGLDGRQLLGVACLRIGKLLNNPPGSE